MFKHNHALIIIWIKWQNTLHWNVESKLPSKLIKIMSTVFVNENLRFLMVISGLLVMMMVDLCDFIAMLTLKNPSVLKGISIDSFWKKSSSFSYATIFCLSGKKIKHFSCLAKIKVTVSYRFLIWCSSNICILNWHVLCYMDGFFANKLVLNVKFVLNNNRQLLEL